jgi:glycosyltransferase 2 family protein
MLNIKNIKALVLLISIIFLCIFIGQINVEQVITQLHTIGWQFLLVMLVTGFAYLLASTAWLLCFNTKHQQLTPAKIFAFRQIGETLTTVNPANIIVGESAKVYLLKKEGISYEEGMSSIVISRLLIFISLLFLTCLLPFALYQLNDTVLPMTFLSMPRKLGSIVLILLSIILMFGSIYLLVHPKLYLHRFIKSVLNRFKNIEQNTETNLDSSKTIEQNTETILESSKTIEQDTETILRNNQSNRRNTIELKIYNTNLLISSFYKEHKGKLLLAFTLSIVHWLMGAVEVYLLLDILDYNISFTNAILIEVGVIVIKSIGAFIPLQIGVEEYANKLMLSIVTLPNNGLWLTISILRRTRQVIWLLIGGILCVFLYKKIRVNEKSI